MTTPRALTTGESKVLRLIQDGHGPQNTEADVFFTSTGKAALFIKARDGSSTLAVVLTNLAAWREDGVIPNDEELRTEWLRIPSTQPKAYLGS